MYERLRATQVNVATAVEGNDNDANTLR
jgi:hypothetical protein